MNIKKIEIRKILNSGGKPAIEATVILYNDFYGVASNPSAILPGKRELKVTDYNQTNSEKIEVLKREIYSIQDVNQEKLDLLLARNIVDVGSDVTLAISLAFARAFSKFKNETLVKYISKLVGTSSVEIAPFPLIAIFSGGVHSNNHKDSFQQIMLSVNTADFCYAVNIILEIYNKVEEYIVSKNLFVELGASSGFVVKDISCEEQLKLLSSTIHSLGYEDIVTIAIDVAAEHLKKQDKYFFENKFYTPDEFCNLLQGFIATYNITFVEDPFDFTDKEYWIKLKDCNNNLIVVGDDLFATQSKYINSEEANGIIIKMNQVGTLFKTIETIKLAKSKNLKLCVSHRSLETEDTFICDLAVAVNSDYIKIGGPRRNDRISKYNRLLKIIDAD